MAIQHSDPNHLNPEQAADFAETCGIDRQQFESAMHSDNPPPYVQFNEPRPPFKVFHRDDLRKWAEAQ